MCNPDGQSRGSAAQRAGRRPRHLPLLPAHRRQADLLSYGVTQISTPRNERRTLSAFPPPRPRFACAIHARIRDTIIFGDYVFVHAGLRPGIAVARQKISDLRWIREPFLGHDDPHEKFVIHGHTVTETVDARSNRIGIDTGAFAPAGSPPSDSKAPTAGSSRR
jgi:hypothetical protein